MAVELKRQGEKRKGVTGFVFKYRVRVALNIIPLTKKDENQQSGIILFFTQVFSSGSGFIYPF